MKRFSETNPTLDLRGENYGLSDSGLDELYSIKVKHFSRAEVAEIEREEYIRLTQEAVDGNILWYQIKWRNQQEGVVAGWTEIFRRINNPLESHDLVELTAKDKYPSGTEFELFCFTGQNAQKLIEVGEMYDTFFDPTGTVASLTVPIDFSLSVPDFERDSFITAWVK